MPSHTNLALTAEHCICTNSQFKVSSGGGALSFQFRCCFCCCGGARAYGPALCACHQYNISIFRGARGEEKEEEEDGRSAREKARRGDEQNRADNGVEAVDDVRGEDCVTSRRFPPHPRSFLSAFYFGGDGEELQRRGGEGGSTLRGCWGTQRRTRAAPLGLNEGLHVSDTTQ